MKRLIALRALRHATTLRARYVSTDQRQILGRNVIETLESRGFVSALTHDELRKFAQRKTCIYGGVDPSAASLHVGNLVALMGLLHWRLAGHDVLALIGGATGSIGDPSGKDLERPALSDEVLSSNAEEITAQVHRFFANGDAYIARQGEDTADQSGSVTVVNNLDWFKPITFIEFLRDVGRKARVNTMIARESVKSRLESESGISFTEFTYQLLQAYDFAHLHKEHGCAVQLGGSDQWGNIVAGIDLIKRQSQDTKKDAAAFGMTLPLLTTPTGEKFGKSAGNAVWLDDRMTGVYEFYQFFFRLPDESVEAYLKLFTLLPLPEIQKVMTQHNHDPRSRHAQKVLAEHVTELVHGYENLSRSLRVTQLLYHTPRSQWKSEDVLKTLGPEPFFHRVDWSDIKNSPVTKLMVQYGMVRSRAVATGKINSRAIHVMERQLKDPRDEVMRRDLIDGHILVIRMGKSKHLVFYVDV